MFGSLKSLFGGSGAEPPPERPVGPFGLGIGRGVALDVMRLRLEEKKLAMAMPPETLVISGYGTAALDGASTLHRFYNDDNVTLQMLCSGGSDEASVREITLFQVWDELVPATASEWAQWDGEGGRIGAAVFEADGFRFERVWGEPTTPWIAAAEFTETVGVDEGPEKHIHQKIMPYRREVGSLVESLLITVERDLASRDRGSICFMIGYGLSPGDVSPV